MSQTTIETFFAELPTKTGSTSNDPWITLNFMDGQSAQAELLDRDTVGILVSSEDTGYKLFYPWSAIYNISAARDQAK
ncbi:MAG: hypothetical protein ACLQUY_05415 [Ktedonobacterales bacterium]